MILPFSLSKPQRNGEFYVKRHFAIYLGKKIYFVSKSDDPSNGILMSSTKKQNFSFPNINSYESNKEISSTWFTNRFSPFRLVTTNIITIIFVTTVSIFSYEFLIEGSHDVSSHLFETAFVAVTLFILIPPLLYLFSYRPLLSNMHKLQQTEKKLSLLATALECADDGIVITNNQGDIQWTNPAFAEMANVSSLEIQGENLRILETEYDFAEDKNRRWETILSGQTWKEELNIRPRQRDGYTKERIITPVRGEDGEISHLIFLEKDVTGQRELEKTNKILATASQTLSQHLDLDSVSAIFLDLLKNCIPFDNAALVLVHHEDRFAIRAGRGEQFGEKFQENKLITVNHAIDSPNIQALLTTRESICIPDTAVYPGWQPLIDGGHGRNWLEIPLIVNSELIGFCVLEKNEPNFFATQHIDIAKALANQAAVAIQNAQLFEQVETGRDRLQSLSHRLVEAQETERRYIARELHDEAGQSLASLKIHLLLLEKQADQPKAIMAGIADMKQQVDNISENLHRIAANLRPASLDHLGLLPALSQLVETVSQNFNLVGEFEALGLEKRLPSYMETAVYRIVQEALTNVIRHAQATRVDVILKQGETNFIIIIEDNGIGFDTSAVMNNLLTNKHLGLIGIRERVEMLGGTFTIESSKTMGSTVRIEVPHVHSHTNS